MPISYFLGALGGVGLISRLGTIRWRLYLAFGFAAGMTVVGSLFALYASGNIAATMTEIISRSMPATVELLRLAEEASTLVASAPRLMSAQTDNHRDEISGDIAAQSKNLSARIERLRQLNAIENDELETARAAMVERLDALNQAVTERMKISAQRRALTVTVRKAHEDLLDAITPAIDDANFDLMTRNQAPATSTTLNQSIDALRRLLEIQAGINLLAGLLIELSIVTRCREPCADARPDCIGGAQYRSQSEGPAAIRSAEENRRTLSAPLGRRGQRRQSSRSAPMSSTASMTRNKSMPRPRRKRRACGRPSKSLIERQGTFARSLSARAMSQIRIGRILLFVL